uniref:Uncharacterized protein n=1 Tax=Meloidogyne incognita TaxID=6306 RepID=A0A914LW31_MELIC
MIIAQRLDVQIKKEYLNLNAKYTREMIEEITEIAKESIENGGIKLQKNEASKYLKKIYAFSEKYEISYNSVKKIRNNLIAQQEVNKETMEKELSKEKSKQEIEENNGNSSQTKKRKRKEEYTLEMIKEIYYIAREYEYLANSDNHSSEVISSIFNDKIREFSDKYLADISTILSRSPQNWESKSHRNRFYYLLI